jgi:hypothetical protein
MISLLSSELLPLLSNKYVLGGISVLIALLVSYFKGSASAKKAAQEAVLEAERAQSARLRAAEAKNAFLKSKGDQTNADINAYSSIDDLISLWNDVTVQKGPGSPPPKKPE